MLAPALVRPQSQCLDMTGCLRPHLAAAHPQLQYRPQGCRAVPHGPAVCVSGGDPGSLPHRRLRSIVEGVLVRNALCFGSSSLLPSAVWVGVALWHPVECCLFAFSWWSARDNPLVNSAAVLARVEGNRFDSFLMLTCVIGSMAVSAIPRRSLCRMFTTCASRCVVHGAWLERSADFCTSLAACAHLCRRELWWKGGCQALRLRVCVCFPTLASSPVK
jgi:hypothetical protein